MGRGKTFPWGAHSGPCDYHVLTVVRPAGCPCRYSAEVWVDAGPRQKPRALWSRMGNDRTALEAEAHRVAPGLVAAHRASEPGYIHPGPGALSDPDDDDDSDDDIDGVDADLGEPVGVAPAPANGVVNRIATVAGVVMPPAGKEMATELRRLDVKGRNERECWAANMRDLRTMERRLAMGYRPVMECKEDDGTVRYRMPFAGRTGPFVEMMPPKFGKDDYLLVHAGAAADAGRAARVT